MGVPAVFTNASGAQIAFPTGYALPGFPGQSRTFADLYYNRYRDYDTSTGRYIQADPIGLAGGANPYSYAEANPLRYMDPDGLKASTGAVIDVGIEWWVRRQVERAATRRIPVIGPALSAGDAIGGALAVAIFLCNQEDDNNECERAKRDAARIYNELTTRAIPQYMYASRHGMADRGHHIAITQGQNSLKDALRRIRHWCKVLPPEYIKWERIANQRFPIRH